MTRRTRDAKGKDGRTSGGRRGRAAGTGRAAKPGKAGRTAKRAKTDKPADPASPEAAAGPGGREKAAGTGRADGTVPPGGPDKPPAPGGHDRPDGPETPGNQTDPDAQAASDDPPARDSPGGPSVLSVPPALRRPRGREAVTDRRAGPSWPLTHFASRVEDKVAANRLRVASAVDGHVVPQWDFFRRMVEHFEGLPPAELRRRLGLDG